MERALLQAFLEEGLSLEAIGERVGKDPSTIGYWCKRYGLQAVGHERYAPRGGLSREALEPLLAEGLTLAQMAERLDRSISTVRHWLGAHGLETLRARMRETLPADRPLAFERTCLRHGRTRFVRDGRGYYRCANCRQERVVARRRRVKEVLVKEAGGRCAVCGYDRWIGALHFHHRDPAEKAFGIAAGGMARSLERMRAEAKKCVLLCSNCHAEVGAKAITIDSLPEQ